MEPCTEWYASGPDLAVALASGDDRSGPKPRADPPERAEGVGQGRARPCVLIVEDEPTTQDIYRTILEFAGYRVSVVANGLDAVTRARVELPDVILMDINLPGQDGWAATRAIKRDQRTREIPVIGISASAGPEFSRRAASIGFESYHAKPFSPVSMLSQVQRVLGPDEEPGS